MAKTSLIYKRQVFLRELAKGSLVTEAAKAAGIGRATVYEWKRANPDIELLGADGEIMRDEGGNPITMPFADAWDNAVDAGTDLIEDEAHRRAVEGVLTPVFHGGVKVGEVREYSDRLLELILKARRPRKYAEQKR